MSVLRFCLDGISSGLLERNQRRSVSFDPNSGDRPKLLPSSSRLRSFPLSTCYCVLLAPKRPAHGHAADAKNVAALRNGHVLLLIQSTSGLQRTVRFAPRRRRPRRKLEPVR